MEVTEHATGQVRDHHALVRDELARLKAAGPDLSGIPGPLPTYREGMSFPEQEAIRLARGAAGEIELKVALAHADRIRELTGQLYALGAELERRGVRT